MADIDIGEVAINRLSTFTANWTIINKGNPANASGTITTIEIWANVELLNAEVATFSESGGDLSTRDTHTIGSVTPGSKQTFSGLNIDVQIGDYIGIHYTSGTIERHIAGYAGLWAKSGDYIPCTNIGMGSYPGDAISLYGTGDFPATFNYFGYNST